jgi:hypothetical protein
MVAIAFFGILRALKIKHNYDLGEVAGMAIPAIIGVFMFWMCVCFVCRLLGIWPVWPFSK